MVHRNARLAEAGRLILVQRVLSGRPISHIAKELGVSRTCAHRRVAKLQQSGRAGLRGRSSRRRSMPTHTAPMITAALLHAHIDERLGRDELAERFAVRSTTASRLIARAGLPALHELDPVTGVQIRASRATEHRYEHEALDDLIHIDVRKLGRIPDGGGWCAHGRSNEVRGRGIGFDYLHVAVDDHSRLGFVRAMPDETGRSCAAFLNAAAEFFASHGIRIRRVKTDDALNYTRSTDFQHALAVIGAKHITIRPHCPWQNGKAKRFNRTPEDGCACRRPNTSNNDRLAALQPWLEHYNYARRHTPPAEARH